MQYTSTHSNPAPTHSAAVPMSTITTFPGCWVKDSRESNSGLLVRRQLHPDRGPGNTLHMTITSSTMSTVWGMPNTQNVSTAGWTAVFRYRTVYSCRYTPQSLLTKTVCSSVPQGSCGFALGTTSLQRVSKCTNSVSLVCWGKHFLKHVRGAAQPEDGSCRLRYAMGSDQLRYNASARKWC